MRSSRKMAGKAANDALKRRLSFVSGERLSKRADAAVQRVLALLTDESLAAEAARGRSADHVELECGIIDQVWEDPRLFNRRNQLQRQGVSVEKVEVETTVAGQTFRRFRLLITF